MPNHRKSIKTLMQNATNLIIEAKKEGWFESRDLHSFLTIREQAPTWIRRKVSELRFKPHKDYSTYMEKHPMGKPAKYYRVTFEAGIELVMSHKVMKGYKVNRRIFIDEYNRLSKGGML